MQEDMETDEVGQGQSWKYWSVDFFGRTGRQTGIKALTVWVRVYRV